MHDWLLKLHESHISANASIKSKLEHLPGNPRAFDQLSCPRGREFDTRMCPGGGHLSIREGEGWAFEQNQNT